VDKSYIIRQRLDELRKTTRNVITKKPKKNKSQVKISPPGKLFSIHNHVKEIKVLRLKPMSAKIRLPETTAVPTEDSAVGALIANDISPVRCEQVNPKSPAKAANPLRKPISPLRRPSPLQVQNHTLSLRAASGMQSSRPSSSKENKKPHEELKLKVPDVKLSMTAVNQTELLPPSFIQSKVPFWLQNSALQPYPYNFIWAVRKKLEAYTSAEEKKQAYQKKIDSRIYLETPQVRNLNKMKKGRKLPDHLLTFKDEKLHELQRPTIGDVSEPNTNSNEREVASEANTYSEISSIKSDMVLKSKSHEKEQQKDDDEDDTTISESVFFSLKDDKFIGKKRESVNSEFSQSSFNEKVEDLLPEHVSPNTSEKRNNFFSSTLLPKEVSLPRPEQARSEKALEQLNDLANNKLSKDKEEEYQKMLSAFNQSLSQVIQVNNILKLNSRSSADSSKTTSATVKNYSSTFENNLESEMNITSAVSEIIETVARRSPQSAQVANQHSETNSSIKTFIEDSNTLKPEVDDAIEDPPIIYNEPAQEFSNSSTKVTTTTTAKIVQQKISIEKKEERENTLKESKLLNMFRQSDSETSFNIVDNNASFGTVSCEL
jgi:methyl-accepting chemotaxis protein